MSRFFCEKCKIAAINDIDLTKTIFEKDKKAAIKYQHERDLEGFLKEN